MEYRTHFVQFKALLQKLEGSQTRIRLRASGEPWGSFSTVILVSDNAMILHDGEDQRTIISLRNIIEFEIDKPVMGFREKAVYEVQRS